MGQSLFKFEDDFVSSVCMGMDDGEVEDFWVAALDAGAAVLEQSVRDAARRVPTMKRHARRLRVTLSKGAYGVVVPSDIADEVIAHELGDGGQPPVPTLRSGLIRGSGDAARAITRALEMS